MAPVWPHRHQRRLWQLLGPDRVRRPPEAPRRGNAARPRPQPPRYAIPCRPHGRPWPDAGRACRSGPQPACRPRRDRRSARRAPPTAPAPSRDRRRSVSPSSTKMARATSIEPGARPGASAAGGAETDDGAGVGAGGVRSRARRARVAPAREGMTRPGGELRLRLEPGDGDHPHPAAGGPHSELRRQLIAACQIAVARHRPEREEF